MSGNSSEEEPMDALDIKPPQHVHRHHKERKRDRSHKHPKSHRNLKDGEEEERRQAHHHHHRQRGGPVGDMRDRRDGGHHSRQERYPQQMQQQQMIPQQEVRHRSSSRKYHSGEGIPSTSRSHKSGVGGGSRRFTDICVGDEHQVVKLAKDKRSKDLREAMEKRKRLEMENEKALREIERRREQERVSEDSGGSGGRSNKHKRLLEQQAEHHRSSKYADDERGGNRGHPQESPSPDKDRLETDELQDHVNLEIQDIEESSSELEEGEDRTPHPGGGMDPQDQHSDRSNVSSASPSERDREERPEEEPSKATSDVSSTTSSSRKSEGRSDVSSSSSSSGDDTESEKEDGESKKKQLNGDNDGPKPAKVARVDSPGTPGSLKDVGSPVHSEPNESRGSDSNIPTVIVTAEDEDEKDLLPPYLPAVQGCRRVEEFSLLNRIEEGTYGVVYRAKDKRTDEIVALKRLKMEKEKDGFPITSLREINTLLKAQHENIVTVREIVVGSNTDKIFLVMDYVEHDLKALMETLKLKGQVFLPEEVKCLMIQLLRAVAHMHDNWILHRDLKTSNLLLSHKGILKVGDFGLAREYGSPLKQYTPIVVTLWYRAPELLLGGKEYSCPIDVWSVGCIFGELLKMEPMFPGKSEANQLNLIFQSLGTPNDRIWPGYSQMPLLQKITFADYPVNKLKTRFGHLTEQGIDLMNCFLKFNPAKRITADEALSHPFFKEAPLAINPSMFPTWPAKSEMGHRKAAASPKPPSGGQQFKGLKEDEDSQGFFLGGNDARRHNLGGGFSLKF